MSKKKTSNPELREAVLNKYDWHCAYCGCGLNWNFHIDHFIPKRRYKYFLDYEKELPIGEDELDNYMPSCASCNSSKSDLDIESFRARILDRVSRLNRLSGEYNLAKRFGLITENEIEVLFYFEKFDLQHN